MYGDSQKRKNALEDQLRRLQDKNARLVNEIKAILIQNGIQAAVDDLQEEAARKATRFDKELAKSYQGRSGVVDNIEPPKKSSFHGMGISSQAYRVLKKEAGKDETISGFRNVADSGIPGLKSMLFLIAGNVRQERAHIFSRGVEIFETEMVDWTSNDYFNEPITAKEREVMSSKSEELFQEYVEVSSSSKALLS